MGECTNWDGVAFKSHYNGHIVNAKHLILDKKLATLAELAYMSDGDVEKLISEHYIALVPLNRRDVEEVVLIPIEAWGSFPVIKRTATKV